jgi:hypothetical protein
MEIDLGVDRGIYVSICTNGNFCESKIYVNLLSQCQIYKRSQFENKTGMRSMFLVDEVVRY